MMMMNNRVTECVQASPSGVHLNGGEMLSHSRQTPRWSVRLIAFSGRRLQINYLTECINTNDSAFTTISSAEWCVHACMYVYVRCFATRVYAKVAVRVHGEVREANECDWLWLAVCVQQSIFDLSRAQQKCNSPAFIRIIKSRCNTASMDLVICR